MPRVTPLLNPLLLSSTIILLNLIVTEVAFAFITPLSQRSSFKRHLDVDEKTYDDDDETREEIDLPASLSSSSQRRTLIKRAAAVSMGSLTASSSIPGTTTTSHFLHHSQTSGCCSCGISPQKLYSRNMLQPLLQLPSPANAVVDMTPPPNFSSRSVYSRPRNSCLDRFFSFSMSTGMDEYEAKAYPYKSRLFDRMLRFVSRAAESSSPAVAPSSSILGKNSAFLDNKRPIIIEVGMGTFPNAPYYANALRENTTTVSSSFTTTDSRLFKHGLDIISLDPNDFMFDYAIDSAKKSGLLSPLSTTSLRKVHGVAESLPFEDGTIDAVVGTLTLCSVIDQQVALDEIQRVLKPKTGVYLFWEHVLSERDVGLAFQQRLLSPLQTIVADGCHLDRRTGYNIENAGFRGGVEMEYLMLNIGGGASIISPTVCGIAHA